MAAPFKKHGKVKVRSGKFAGETGTIVDDPEAIPAGWSVPVLLDDPLGMEIKTIVQIMAKDLKKN